MEQFLFINIKKMKAHAVSILISVYNGEKTLDRCFESLYKQTYRDFCIVCIDDASTDTSLKILKKWQASFGESCFQIINNSTNIRLTRSLNRGLEVIGSLYTARIDQDDWWDPTKIEKQIAFLNTNPSYGIVGTNYINYAEEIERRVILPKTYLEISKTIFWRNPFAHSCVMYRTGLIRSLGSYNPDVPYVDDYELWVRCLPYTKFHNLQEFLCYRSIGSGISIENQNAQMRQVIRTRIKYIRRYRYPWYNYFYLLEPLVIILIPTFLKKLKRRYL